MQGQLASPSQTHGAIPVNAHQRGGLDAFPLELVGEIHLAGHDTDGDEHGRPLLIDSHNREVAEPVWALYEYTTSKTGPRPSLIEWDSELPEWPVLEAEAARAASVMSPALAE